MKEKRQYKNELEAIRQKLSGKLPQKLIVLYTTQDGAEHTGTIEECIAAGGKFKKVVSGNTVDDIIRYMDIAAKEGNSANYLDFPR